MVLAQCVAVVLALALAAVSADAQRCGDGIECPRNLCCNKHEGTCGLGEEYCNQYLCISGACYSDRRNCDRFQVDGAACPNNHCCSQYGKCGLGDKYCGYGCRSGPCHAHVPCGVQAGGKLCPSNLCCSQDGNCGMGVEYCGHGCQSGACHSAPEAALPSPPETSGAAAKEPPTAPTSRHSDRVCASSNDTHCYYRNLSQEDDETVMPGSCLCYDMCAHNKAAGLTEAGALNCFVDCVLRDGGGGWVLSPGDGDEVGGGAEPAAIADEASSTSLLPGLLLGRTVCLAVTRPKVLRSIEEKQETEELLLIEVDFKPDPQLRTLFYVYLNTPEAGEVDDIDRDRQNDPRFLAYEGRAVRKFPITRKLEAMGADGDKTIVVSLVASKPKYERKPYWYETNMIFIRSVRIVYEPKGFYYG